MKALKLARRLSTYTLFPYPPPVQSGPDLTRRIFLPPAQSSGSFLIFLASSPSIKGGVSEVNGRRGISPKGELSASGVTSCREGSELNFVVLQESRLKSHERESESKSVSITLYP